MKVSYFSIFCQTNFLHAIWRLCWKGRKRLYIIIIFLVSTVTEFCQAELVFLRVTVGPQMPWFICSLLDVPLEEMLMWLWWSEEPQSDLPSSHWSLPVEEVTVEMYTSRQSNARNVLWLFNSNVGRVDSVMLGQQSRSDGEMRAGREPGGCREGWSHHKQSWNREGKAGAQRSGPIVPVSPQWGWNCNSARSVRMGMCCWDRQQDRQAGGRWALSVQWHQSHPTLGL